MNKNLTELVFILDRSGSMGGLEADTIGGFNAMLEKQKKEEGEAYVSTILFDHEVEVLHDRVSIDKIQPITDRDYFVRGSTALLDALGGAIHHIANVHKYAREEDRPGKTIFVITTDGCENASQEYSYRKVKQMVPLPGCQYGRHLRRRGFWYPGRACRSVQGRRCRREAQLRYRQRRGQ